MNILQYIFTLMIHSHKPCCRIFLSDCNRTVEKSFIFTKNTLIWHWMKFI